MNARSSWCGVPTPSVVYACPHTREEFDLIGLEPRVGKWQSDEFTTNMRADGQQWERRCTSKTLGDFAGDTVTVIFQWWEERPIAVAAAADAVQGGAA